MSRTSQATSPLSHRCLHQKSVRRKRSAPFSQLPAIVMLFTCFFISTPEVYAGKGKNTAANIFRQIPADIFDTTTEPIDEDNKELLLDRGYITNWVITKNETDALHIKSMSINPSEVDVYIYRTDEGGVAAIGTRTSETCSAELWHFDAAGNLIPLAPPPLSPRDFLAQTTRLSREITATFSICLTENRLEAIPMFWSDAGQQNFPVVNRVFFIWNGTEFQKSIARIEPEVDIDLAPEHVSPFIIPSVMPW